MSTIDISKMNKADVLCRLFNASKVQGMGVFQPHSLDMEMTEAKDLLKDGDKYFDYVRGRIMKVDLSGDELRVAMYDRDNGEGSAAKALGV